MSTDNATSPPSAPSSTRSSGQSISIWGLISLIVGVSAVPLALVTLLFVCLPLHFWPDNFRLWIPFLLQALFVILGLMTLLGLAITAGSYFETNRRKAVTVFATYLHGSMLGGLLVLLAIVSVWFPSRLSYQSALVRASPTLDREPTPANRVELSPLTEVPDRLELLELLKQRRYRTLERRIRRVQTRYREGRTSDRPVDYVFVTFGASGKDVERRLDEWVRKRPNSAIPRVARAYHHAHVGYLTRGTQWAHETSEGQFNRMRTHHDTAIRDLRAALDLDPRTTVAYAKLIELSSYNSAYSTERVHNVLEAGLKQDPASWEIRQDYLGDLEPKWGGSLKAMKTFIQQSLEHADTNPQLRVLAGYLAYAKARDPRFDDPSVKIRLLNRALEFGNSPLVLEERAEWFMRQDNATRALEDVNRALKLMPKTASFLETRADIYVQRGETPRALKDLNLALKLDSLDYKLLTDRARILVDQKAYRKAVRDYENATIFDPGDEDHWFSAGYLQLAKLEKYKEAEKNLRRAIELEPNSGLYHYNYIVTLHRQVDCRITGAIQEYLDVCEQGGDCKSKHQRYVRKVRRALKKHNECYQE